MSGEDELRVLGILLHDLGDGVGHRVRLEPTSLVGEDHHVAVLEQGVDDGGVEALAIGQDAVHGDDEGRGVELALVERRGDARRELGP